MLHFSSYICSSIIVCPFHHVSSFFFCFVYFSLVFVSPFGCVQSVSSSFFLVYFLVLFLLVLFIAFNLSFMLFVYFIFYFCLPLPSCLIRLFSSSFIFLCCFWLSLPPCSCDASSVALGVVTWGCDFRSSNSRVLFFVWCSCVTMSIVLVAAGEAARISGTVVLTGKRETETEREGKLRETSQRRHRQR